MADYSQRHDYAKQHSRCDGERDAMMFNGYRKRQARCGNCGWKFPPESPSQDDTHGWCSIWTTKKQVSQFCRRWAHNDDVRAGIAPEWAVKYTKERKKNGNEVR